MVLPPVYCDYLTYFIQILDFMTKHEKISHKYQYSGIFQEKT